MNGKVIVPLNIIANCIMQNQGLQNNPLNHEELASYININENANQSYIVIHQIEDPNIFRKKYPYEKFIVEELPEFDSKLKKDYSNWLKLAYNIEPLAFFLYKNPQLDIKTMKSYVSTVREYYQEYRGFDIDALKSHFIEKNFKKVETKETLIKKWKQWKRVWEISFEIDQDNYPKIKFSSTKRTCNQIIFSSVKEIIEHSWNVLIEKGDTADALLLHLMYELGLRTGEVRYLKFEDISDVKGEPNIKVYDSVKGKIKQVSISQEIYNEIKAYENELIGINKWIKSVRKSNKDESITGHFIFEDWKDLISRKFKNKFRGKLAYFNLKTKDVRVASIIDRGSKKSNSKSKLLLNQKDSKVNEEQKLSLERKDKGWKKSTKTMKKK